MFMSKNIITNDKKAAFLRLESVLREKNITVPDFQATLNIGSQVWNNWKNRGLPPKEFIKLAVIIGVSTNWLATGAGEKYSDHEKNQNKKTAIQEQSNHYLSNENEMSLLNAFRLLTKEQQQMIIANTQNIARNNEQIIKELKIKMEDM
jgi:hypothetical protein